MKLTDEQAEIVANGILEFGDEVYALKQESDREKQESITPPLFPFNSSLEGTVKTPEANETSKAFNTASTVSETT